MGHYSRIARELAESPEDYAPVLGVDADSGESLWEPWIGGFERGMRLRRAVWRQIARSDDREAATSLNLIIALSDSCRGRSELTEEEEEKLRGLAPELIPEFVDNLYAWWKSRQGGEGNGGRRRSLRGWIGTNRRGSAARRDASSPAARSGNTSAACGAC